MYNTFDQTDFSDPGCDLFDISMLNNGNDRQIQTESKQRHAENKNNKLPRKEFKKYEKLKYGCVILFILYCTLNVNSLEKLTSIFFIISI